MTTTLDAIVGGVTYSLSDGSPFYWIGEAGWSMAPTARITQGGPLQHGDTDLDFRLRARTADLKLLINHDPNAAGELDYFTSRATLQTIFRPSRSPIVLRWTLPDGAQRQIDVHFVDGLTLDSGDRNGFAHEFVATLRAADPTFYDPAGVGYTFNVGAGSNGFAFPIGFPISFGSSTVDQERAIAYDGTWRTYPIVTITGPITDPIITNETTGDKLDFTGTTIGSGSTYTIDLRYGHKTVVDQAGTNKISTLSTDSDLATFAIEAAPDAPGGVNTISVTGSAANSTTEIYLTYNTRYVAL